MTTLAEWFSLALEHHRAGNLPQAEQIYRSILTADDQHADAWHLLGVIAAGQGDSTQAEACLCRAIQLNPLCDAYHHNLGELYRRTGRWSLAVAEFEESLRQNPNSSETLAGLGDCLRLLGQPSAAVSRCRQAVALDPDNAAALVPLAIALREFGAYQEAEQVCTRLLALQPQHDEGWDVRSSISYCRGHYAEALEFSDRALHLRPQQSNHHWNRSLALAALGLLPQAIGSLEQLLEQQPGFARAHSNLLYLSNYDPELGPVELWQLHQQFGEIHDSPTPRMETFANTPERSRRLRVGYVSPNFHNHPVAAFLEPILLHTHRADFETVLFSDVGTVDDAARRLRQLADQCLETEGRSDDEVASLIRAEGIDILVDLAGHTAQNRLLVFAQKPAPVQVEYLGYPNTSGLSAIDYRLTDDVADPEGESVCHSEQLLRLEGGFCCYRPPTDAPEVAHLPALAAGYVTFGSLHHLARLNDRVLDLWAEILGRVPQSRLLIVRHDLHGEIRDRLSLRLCDRGLGPDRWELSAAAADGCSHLDVYGRIDITLDTFPWSGHTTACESLWMGVPVITLRGTRHAGRMVASLLTAAGNSEWIAADCHQYGDLAAHWADHLPQLAELRMRLRRQVAASPLCDGPSFARRLEQAYRAMWESWCRRSNGGAS